jgi:hypothetical protein
VMVRRSWSCGSSLWLLMIAPSDVGGASGLHLG